MGRKEAGLGHEPGSVLWQELGQRWGEGVCTWSAERWVMACSLRFGLQGVRGMEPNKRMTPRLGCQGSRVVADPECGGQGRQAAGGAGAADPGQGDLGLTLRWLRADHLGLNSSSAAALLGLLLFSVPQFLRL